MPSMRAEYPTAMIFDGCTTRIMLKLAVMGSHATSSHPGHHKHIYTSSRVASALLFKAGTLMRGSISKQPPQLYAANIVGNFGLNPTADTFVVYHSSDSDLNRALARARPLRPHRHHPDRNSPSSESSLKYLDTRAGLGINSPFQSAAFAHRYKA
jgi:hypothetical protein